MTIIKRRKATKEGLRKKRDIYKISSRFFFLFANSLAPQIFKYISNTFFT